MLKIDIVQQKKKPKEQFKTLHCTVFIENDKMAIWKDQDQNEVALKFVRTGIVCDLRDYPPYLQILPCPYCGVVEDKNHHPEKHTGIKNV